MAALSGDYQEARRLLNEIFENPFSTVYSEPEDWRNYLLLTIRYLEGDLPSVEELASILRENRSVALRLATGLRRFGNIDYNRDYSAS